MGAFPERVAERLIDRHGREISHLRLSITDLCNLRCVYCMPEAGVPKLAHDQVLRFEEIVEVVREAAALGVRKVRLTGGEPLARRGVVALVRELAAIPGIADLAMTTNATRLDRFAEALKEAGLGRLNVSLDTLDPDVYARTTRCGDLRETLRGIEAARAAGFPIKLNAVLLPEILDAGRIESIVLYAAERGFEVRFIERMGFGSDTPWVSEDRAFEVLARRWRLERVEGDSPHVRSFECGPVRVGFISPRTHAFCVGCDKLRLTADGQLRVCLASALRLDLRAVVRRPHAPEDVRRLLRDAVRLKPAAGPWDTRNEMWRVGG